MYKRFDSFAATLSDSFPASWRRVNIWRKGLQFSPLTRKNDIIPSPSTYFATPFRPSFRLSYFSRLKLSPSLNHLHTQTDRRNKKMTLYFENLLIYLFSVTVLYAEELYRRGKRITGVERRGPVM